MLIAMILAGIVAGPDASQTPPAPVEGTHREVRVITLDGPGGPGGAGPRGPALDKNGDGFVTRDEFTAPQTQAFDFLDKNRDGKISSEEFAEGRATAMTVLGGAGGTGGLGRGPVRVHVGGGPEGALFSGQMGGPAGGDSRVFVIRRDGADGELPPPPPGARIEVDRIVGAPGEGPGDLDKDHDGKVSEEEFLAPLREAFQRMDADHSGYLESGEKGESGVHIFTRRMNASAE